VSSNKPESEKTSVFVLNKSYFGQTNSGLYVHKLIFNYTVKHIKKR
jgi:hypothetical protein